MNTMERLPHVGILAAVALVSGSVLFSQDALATPVKIYWTDRDNATVNVTSVGNGITNQIVAPTGGRAQDVDLAANGRLFFGDWGPVGPPGNQGSINRVNRNGNSLATVLNTGDAVHQLAIDDANSRVYFTRAVSYDNREISRVDMSGANYTQLRTGVGSGTNGWFYSGIALDVPNNAIYWGDIGVLTPAPPADGAVNRMDLAGNLPTTLSPHVDGRGRGMALDSAQQLLFLTAHDPLSPGTGGGLFSYDIANNILTTLISDPGSGYWDVELDTVNQVVYWADYGRGQIRSANYDGSNQQVVLSNLGGVYGIALQAVPEPTTLALFGLALAGLGFARRRVN